MERGLVIHHPHPARQPAAGQAVQASRRQPLSRQPCGQALAQGFHHQRRLSRAGDAGDADQPAQWQAHVQLAQVAPAGPHDLDPAPRRGTEVGARAQARPGQQATGGGIVGGQLGGGSHGQDGATVFSSPRSQLHDDVGCLQRLPIMFHHDDAVATIAQPVQGLEQHGIVAGVQANGGLVEHVAGPGQIGAQLGGEAHPLRLAPAQGIAGAIQCQVTQTHPFQHLAATHDLGHQRPGNGAQALLHLQPQQPLYQLTRRLPHHLHDGPTRQPVAQGLGTEAPAPAGRTGNLPILLVTPTALALRAGTTGSVEGKQQGIGRRQAYLAGGTDSPGREHDFATIFGKQQKRPPSPFSMRSLCVLCASVMKSVPRGAGRPAYRRVRRGAGRPAYMQLPAEVNNDL